MKVNECMCTDVVCVKPETTVKEVAKKMQESHVGCMPVCDTENKIVGLITDRDLTLRCIACDKDYKNTPVSEIMTTNLYTVKPDDSIDHLTQYMCECQVKRIPVIENGCVCGIITLGDLARDPEITTQCVGKTEEGICCGKGKKQKNQE